MTEKLINDLANLLTRKDSTSVAWSKNMVLGSYMEQAEKQEKETRFEIKEEPEYFKKIAIVTGGALMGKLLDMGYGKIGNTPPMNKYGESIIRPILHSISGEESTKIISEAIDNAEKREGDK